MFLHEIDEELSLKIVSIEDAEELFQLTDHSRDHLREWLPWLDHSKTLEDTKNFIQNGRKGFAENKSLTTLVIYHGKVVGTAGFNEIDHPNKIVKIGYWLGKDYIGKGIMTRVVHSLTSYAFNELHMNRVEIRVAEGNQRSFAIPQRLGFQKEGRVREAEWLYDHYVDHLIYSVLASEWKE